MSLKWQKDFTTLFMLLHTATLVVGDAVGDWCRFSHYILHIETEC